MQYNKHATPAGVEIGWILGEELIALFRGYGIAFDEKSLITKPEFNPVPCFAEVATRRHSGVVNGWSCLTHRRYCGYLTETPPLLRHSGYAKARRGLLALSLHRSLPTLPTLSTLQTFPTFHSSTFRLLDFSTFIFCLSSSAVVPVLRDEGGLLLPSAFCLNTFHFPSGTILIASPVLGSRSKERLLPASTGFSSILTWVRVFVAGSSV